MDTPGMGTPGMGTPGMGTPGMGTLGLDTPSVLQLALATFCPSRFFD